MDTDTRKMTADLCCISYFFTITDESQFLKCPL